MKGLEKLSADEIISSVKKDINGRDEDSLKLLQGFYFKIVTEEKIRTSSYRYFYARHALITVSNTLNDTETLDNLSEYHKAKIKFEIANPVTKSETPKTVARSTKFSNAVKKDNSTSQFKI